MSIETEKWHADGEEVHTDSAGAMSLVAECASRDRAQSIALLPEALALLKRYWDTEDIPYGLLEDVLKRAGGLR